jgi:hypothetical protein
VKKNLYVFKEYFSDSDSSGSRYFYIQFSQSRAYNYLPMLLVSSGDLGKLL